MRHRMYIMPDGRPLRAYLADTESAKHNASTRHRHRKQGEDAHLDINQTSSTTSAGGPFTREDEQSQINVAMRAGRSRRRRYFNDKLLRDMAGALTHADMQALFSPVPFGEEGHVTPLQQVLLPEFLPLWDTFRNIDMDKQLKMLEVLEARRLAGHVGKPAGPVEAASRALQAWGLIERRARQALKRAKFAAVHALEVHLHELRPSQETGELVLELPEAFDRLLVHGLAQYHGLRARGQQRGATNLMVVQCPSGSNGALKQQEISCADILLALESMPHGGLTPASLHEFLAGDEYSHSESSYTMV